MRLALVVCIALFALSPAACAKHEADAPAASMSEAQHDSALARSSVPGAGAVQGALDASGKEARRAAGMDSLTR